MTGRKTNTLQLAYAGLGAVFICICSWLVIPGPVPFTMQTFGVFLVMFIDGESFGFKSILTYIFLGLVGLPVFAGFKAGPGTLFGLTGGYILGFIVLGIIYIGAIKVFGRKPSVEIIAMFVGMVLCYIIGTLWFVVMYSKTGEVVSVINALLWCVAPFVIPDLIKMAIAYSISKKIKISI